MGGTATQESLKEFNPLFCLNYSATHKQHHNLVYMLDALDVYNKRLVKRIEVKGFDIKNLRGTDRYLFLEGIAISPKKPLMARLEFEIGYDKSVNRETRIVEDDHVTEKYRTDLANSVLAPLPESCAGISEGVHALVQSIFDEHALNSMIHDGRETKIQENALNDNFYKKEFQTLWNYISPGTISILFQYGVERDGMF